MPNNILKDVLSNVLSDPLQDVFANGAVVGPSYNVVSLTDYLDAFGDITYWDVTEASGSFQPGGAEAGTAAMVMSQTGAGAITYNTTFTDYAGADGGFTYDGTQRLISPTDFALATHPSVGTVGDQTVGYIFDNGGNLSSNASIFYVGGDISSNAATENNSWYSQNRTDYQRRWFHENGSGTDNSILLNAIPPASQWSGEQFHFEVRDTTAKTYTLYKDNAGTLDAGQTSSAYANNPTTSGATNKVLFGGRNGDTAAIPQSGVKQGLIFSRGSKLDTSYMQTMIDKARTAASSGSIYFEADLS